MTPEQISIMAHLREKTDHLISKADKAAFDGEAINWGDLTCFEVLYVQRDDGDSWYEVLIAEAGPHCPKFCAYIRQQLGAAVPVQVRTEW